MSDSTTTETIIVIGASSLIAQAFITKTFTHQAYTDQAVIQQASNQQSNRHDTSPLQIITVSRQNKLILHELTDNISKHRLLIVLTVSARSQAKSVAL